LAVVQEFLLNVLGNVKGGPLPSPPKVEASHIVKKTRVASD
jgi:hypothetical protein